MTGRRRLGDAGERLAERYLVERGWQILERQWRGTGGEIDLVGLDDGTLVVVEVKLRRGEARGAAEEAISRAKSRRLLSLGAQYVESHPGYADHFWRVDLVAITLTATGRVERITHIPNACETG